MITRRILLCSAFAMWLFGSLAGMTALWDHEARPGAAANAPTDWPADSQLAFDRSQSLMLVWIHPHCPCSRATIGQLERLLVHMPDDIDCRVVLTRPSDCDAGFVETDLTRSVRKLPRVSVVIDDDQREAAKFGVSTSGQVLMYGANSQLLFAGGITPGRGHEGDSVGSGAVRDLFRSGPAEQDPAERDDAQQCSVFGCCLFASEPEQDPTP